MTKNMRIPGSGPCRSALRLLAILLALSLGACAPLTRLGPVPEAQTEQAIVPGMPDSRIWMDRDLTTFIRVVIDDNARERTALVESGRPADPLPPVNFLSISGGGDNGAFAAGILAGWTARGTRPEFTVVTGISAGALIAPFAFLGPAYDDVIRTVATSLRPGDVFRARNRVDGLLGDGMASSAPLRRLVTRYVTPELLAEIAREHAPGRALQIATTDLDAGRQVTWDMGAIAAARHAAGARAVPQHHDRLDQHSRCGLAGHDRRGRRQPALPGDARRRWRDHAAVRLSVAHDHGTREGDRCTAEPSRFTCS